MPPELFYYLMAAAVALSSISLVVQAVAAIKTYQAVKKLGDRIEPLLPQAEQALKSAQETLVEGRRQLAEITAKTSEILDVARIQLGHFDQTREEVTTRLRVQLERAELVLDDSLSRFQDVVGSVHRGVMWPVKEVSGLLAGIRAGITTLRQSGRPSVAEATNDDSMFI
jgi:F0F1-type ATP synthase membrane subunit b/b'